MTADDWACSCNHLMERTDIAIQHSLLGHDVRTREYRDGRDARYKTELARAEQEDAA